MGAGPGKAEEGGGRKEEGGRDASGEDWLNSGAWRTAARAAGQRCERVVQRPATRGSTVGGRWFGGVRRRGGIRG